MTRKGYRPRKPGPEAVARRDARRELGNVARRLTPWRNDLAVASKCSTRDHTETDRLAMLATCGRISTEVADTRAEIGRGLADAPQPVRTDSRMVDIGKALDDIDVNIGRILQRLKQDSREIESLAPRA